MHRPALLLMCGLIVSSCTGCDPENVPATAGSGPALDTDSQEMPGDEPLPEQPPAADVPVIEASQVIELFDGHGGRMAVSSKGERLVMSGAQQDDEPGVCRIIVYDIKQGKALREFESFSAGIVPVSISADGRMAAYLTRANFVKVVNVDTGEPLHEFKNSDLTGYYAYQLQISPDGRSVWTYVEGADVASRLLGWSVESGEALAPLAVAGITVKCLDVFPGGQKIAAGYHNGDIRIWDIVAKESIQLAAGRLPEPPLHAGAHVSMKAVAVSPDAKHLASGVMGQNLRLWSLESNKLLRELPSGGGLRNDALSFNPGGTVVVCQGEWPTPEQASKHRDDAHPLHVFDVNSGKRLALLKIPGVGVSEANAWDVGWHGTDLYAALSSGRIHVFDLSQWLE